MRPLLPLESFLIGAIGTTALCGGVMLAIEAREIPSSPERTLEATIDPIAPLAAADPPPAQTIVEVLAEPVDAGIDAPLIDAAPDALDDAIPIEDLDAGEDGGDEEPELVAEANEADAEAPLAMVACGPTECPGDFVCCNASCGICARPGETCSQRVCGMPYTLDSVSCGPATCDVGELCCDAACGVCIQPGEPCLPGSCLSPVTMPVSESCGMMTCNVGLVCCNPSCGICKPPGEPCSHEVCD